MHTDLFKQTSVRLACRLYFRAFTLIYPPDVPPLFNAPRQQRYMFAPRLRIDFLLVLLCSRPQSDIYFVSSAPVSSASNCSSRDTSSHSSPQTPTGYEMPVFPSPLGDGKPSAAE